MNKFKRGERVVFVKDDDYAGVEMPKGTLATYDDDAPTGGLVRWVKLDTGERVAAHPDSIAHVKDHGTGDGSASDICAEPGCNCDLERRFPAPLDPAKVKPGDTVTLENGETTVRGPVTNIEHAPHTQIVVGFAIQNIGWRYIEAGVVAQQDAGVWSLTAHTPAPEPEPYVPDLKHIRSAYVDARHDNDIITSQEAEAEFDRWMATHVVIDPATVDVEALTTVGDEAYLTDQSEFRRDGIQAAILAALAHLGIEVPR